MSKLRYLLLQTRNSDDSMRAQEVACFAKALDCDLSAIDVVDFLVNAPTADRIRWADVVLLGGSGHYSAAENPPTHFGESFGEGLREVWLNRSFDALRDLHRLAKPTFASCWGFQAMARAMGGRCIHDPPRGELGNIQLHLTAAGRSDPLFSQLPVTFIAQAGHEDHVIELPRDAVLLASSDKVTEQAYRFRDRPIYCTQFHPELDRAAMLKRIRAYPGYIQRVVGMSFEQFAANCREAPEANSLLRRFILSVFGEKVATG